MNEPTQAGAEEETAMSWPLEDLTADLKVIGHGVASLFGAAIKAIMPREDIIEILSTDPRECLDDEPLYI